MKLRCKWLLLTTFLILFLQFFFIFLLFLNIFLCLVEAAILSSRLCRWLFCTSIFIKFNSQLKYYYNRTYVVLTFISKLCYLIVFKYIYWIDDNFNIQIIKKIHYIIFFCRENEGYLSSLINYQTNYIELL